jgi:glycosyltransferase involved in cell wall biosynthesis
MGNRLAIAHTESSLGWGGQEIRILTEAAGMIARGHKVTVYCAPPSRLLAEAPRYGVNAVALPIERKRPAGVFAIRRALASRDIDVVNTHSSTDAWLAALACSMLREAPAIVRTRHVSVPVPHDVATRWLYRRATTRIVTTGEALREQLIEHNGIAADRIDSVATGIDAARFAPRDKITARASLGLPADTPLVGIVATLRSWKGHRYLLDAMPRLAHADARLVVVGDGPQRDALVAQSARLGLGERVVFAGDQADVVPWLAALDVFALPSYKHEGVPQALLQAMFAGIACVTTDAGAIAEVARHDDTAWIVAKENPTELARGIDTLLADRALAARLAVNARAYVNAHHSLDTMLDAMESVFRRAIAEHGTR